MEKIWIVAGIVLLIVLLLGAWVVIFQFGGFANLISDEAKDVIDEDKSKFYGTWESNDAENYPYFLFGKKMTFFENGTVLIGIFEDEAFYEISNGKLFLSYDDGPTGTSYDYTFSEDNLDLYLTDHYTWDKRVIAMYTKQ